MRTNLFAASALAVSVLTSAAYAEEMTEEAIQETFQQALELRANGDLYGAIELLNGLLASQPTLHRARLELAVAYYRATEFEKATTLAQDVLDNPDVSDKVKKTVQLFLEQVKGLEEVDDQNRHSWTAGIGLGGGHDTNVNAGPSSDVIDINGAEFQIDPSSSPQSDNFLNLNANINHSYRIPGSLNIGSRPVQALWQSSGSIYQRSYQNEDEFAVDVISASTGIALISKTRWRAKVNLQLDHLSLDNDSLAVYSSVNPSWTYNDGRGNEYTLRGQWLYRDYKKSDDKDRDGYRTAAGIDYSRRISSNIVGQAGVTFSSQDARVEDQKYSAYEAYISSYWNAWNQGSVYGRINYKQTDYKGVVALFNEEREEKEQRYVIGVSQKLTGDLLKNWQVGARITYTSTNANIDIYDYDRTEVSFDINRRF